MSDVICTKGLASRIIEILLCFSYIQMIFVCVIHSTPVIWPVILSFPLFSLTWLLNPCVIHSLHKSSHLHTPD